MQMFDSSGQGDFDLKTRLKSDPDIIRRYIYKGEQPALRSVGEKKWFLNIMELFRTITASGMLEVVLGNPDVLAKQLSLFDD